MAEKNYGNNSQLAELVGYISDAVKFPLMGAGGGFAPIATISAVMGTTAPAGWLACDGSTHNITDYPELAAYFASHFGRSNYFGGNGTTTFAVPDLRGEFLRGTGTNSHSGQGSGAAVGTHQDATEHRNMWSSASGTGGGMAYSDDSHRFINKADSNIGTSTKIYTFNGTATASATQPGVITSRPTNTSVLFIIKATVAGDPNGHVYSTEEQVIGRWIDGKPLYEKTISCGALPNKTTKFVTHNINNARIKKIYGYAYDGTNTIPLPNAAVDAASTIQLYATTTNVGIITLSNLTAYTETYITLQYTKTTD